MAEPFYMQPLRCGLCGEKGQITDKTPGLREPISMTIYTRAPNELRVHIGKDAKSPFYFHEDCEAAKAGNGVLT